MKYLIERREAVHVIGYGGIKRIGECVESYLIDADKVKARRHARNIASVRVGQFVRATRVRDGAVVGVWRRAPNERRVRRV